MKIGESFGKRAGFTLIELLVVIAIIAILAAILLPVLEASERRAQQIDCVNNLKEVTTASLMYVADNHVWLGPMNANYLLSQGDWMGTLLTYYARETNVLVCPTAPPKGNPKNITNPPGTADSAWYWTLTSPPYYGSYAYNAWLENQDSIVMQNATAHPQYLYQVESAVRWPVQTPMFSDGAWLNLDPLETDPPPMNFYAPLGTGVSVTPGGVSEGMPRVCIARHGSAPAGSAPQNVPPATPLPGKINMGFIDGHVELVMTANLWNYYWHQNWKAGPVPP